MWFRIDHDGTTYEVKAPSFAYAEGAFRQWLKYPIEVDWLRDIESRCPGSTWQFGTCCPLPCEHAVGHFGPHQHGERYWRNDSHVGIRR
jgi:hypothetical protein